MDKSKKLSRQAQNKQMLIDLYQKGKTLDEIAESLGVSQGYAQYLYYAICREDPKSAKILREGKRTNKNYVDREKVKELLESGVTIANIGEMFGVSRQAVYNWMKDIDYVRYTPFDARKVKIKEQLRALLKQDPHLTCQELGDELKISHVTVLNYLEEMGIKREHTASAKRQVNVKQALKMYEQGKKIDYIAGKLGVSKITVSRYLHQNNNQI